MEYSVSRPVIIRWFITLLIILFLLIYQLGKKVAPVDISSVPEKTAEESPSIQAQVSSVSQSSEESSLAVQPGPLHDGEYQGEGQGYGGPVKVRLQVSNGYISKIEITEALGEDKPYLRDARKIIPQVIENQSTDLDAISGATTSCYAILDAIDMALEVAEDE